MASNFLSPAPASVSFVVTFQLADGSRRTMRETCNGVSFVVALQKSLHQLLTASGPLPGAFGPVAAASVGIDGAWGPNTAAALYAVSRAHGATSEPRTTPFAGPLSETDLVTAAWIVAGTGAYGRSITFDPPVTPPTWNVRPPGQVLDFDSVVISNTPATPVVATPDVPVPAPDASGDGSNYGVAPVPPGPANTPVRAPGFAPATGGTTTPWRTYALVGVGVVTATALTVLIVRAASTPEAPARRTHARAAKPRKRSTKKTRTR